MATDNTRSIKTKYLNRGEEQHLAHALHANSAVLRCVNNMRLNVYGADVAEVWDDGTGKLFAQVVRRKNNEIKILYTAPEDSDDTSAYDPIRRSIHAFIK
jgi:hypothetical protein